MEASGPRAEDTRVVDPCKAYVAGWRASIEDDDERREVDAIIARLKGSPFAAYVIRELAFELAASKPDPDFDRLYAWLLVSSGAEYLDGRAHRRLARARIDAAFAALKGVRTDSIRESLKLRYLARAILEAVNPEPGDKRSMVERAARFVILRFSLSRVDAHWFAGLLERYTPSRKKDHHTLDVILMKLCARARILGFDEKLDPEDMRKRVARVCREVRATTPSRVDSGTATVP